jgi:acetaldehyde dehydrogenase (acetylating)
MKKLKVAIIGTGNIGTDLLMKCIRTSYIEIVAFVGRRSDSPGIKFANSKGVNVSSDGIGYFINNPGCCDVVYDCTNSYDAIENYKIFKKQSIKTIDLTPAKLGDFCVPDINSELILERDNVNMVTCGGQSCLPMLNVIKKFISNIEYIEVVSQIASDSAGLATRINVDEYIFTTKKAIV